MKCAKSRKLLDLEQAVENAEEEVVAAEEHLAECEEECEKAEKELAAFIEAPEPTLLFGSGVFVDGIPALVLSRWKDTLELVVDDPDGIREMKIQYDWEENRIQEMPFYDAILLFDRLREMGKI